MCGNVNEYITIREFFFQFSCLTMLYQIIVLVIVTVVVTIEAIRLYLGYVGNLLEKVKFIMHENLKINNTHKITEYFFCTITIIYLYSNQKNIFKK